MVLGGNILPLCSSRYECKVPWKSVFRLIKAQDVNCAPLSLITSRRFDAMAHYIYAKHWSLNIKSNWATELYEATLRVVNGHYEQYPKKLDFQDYLTAFHTVLQAMKSGTFNWHASPVTADLFDDLGNGAHRVAAALVYGSPVHCVKYADFRAMDLSACALRNREKFVPGGLAEKYLDAMALEYCKLKPNCYIAVIFPAAQGREEDIYKLLGAYCTIVYKKDVLLSKNGPFNFVRQAYEGAHWLGNWSNGFAGVKTKARGCFPDGYTTKKTVRVYLLECESLKKLTECKNEIRKLFDVGNHSIHTTDDHNDSIRIARLLFCNNSIHHLNNAAPKQLKKFDEYLEKYKVYLQKFKVDDECFCVDGSAVMSAYGLRDCADLDYLHFGYDTIFFDSMISSHNSSLGHHVLSKDDIIFNPTNYFYYNNVKFASLGVVKAMKEKRNEKKDIVDVALINTISL